MHWILKINLAAKQIAVSLIFIVFIRVPHSSSFVLFFAHIHWRNAYRKKYNKTNNALVFLLLYSPHLHITCDCVLIFWTILIQQQQQICQINMKGTWVQHHCVSLKCHIGHLSVDVLIWNHRRRPFSGSKCFRKERKSYER